MTSSSGSGWLAEARASLTSASARRAHSDGEMQPVNGGAAAPPAPPPPPRAPGGTAVSASRRASPPASLAAPTLPAWGAAPVSDADFTPNALAKTAAGGAGATRAALLASVLGNVAKSPPPSPLATGIMAHELPGMPPPGEPETPVRAWEALENKTDAAWSALQWNVAELSSAAKATKEAATSALSAAATAITAALPTTEDVFGSPVDVATIPQSTFASLQPSRMRPSCCCLAALRCILPLSSLG